MMNEKQSTERYAVVTGANKGIGFETVRQLAVLGVTVLLTARNEKRGTEAVASLHGLGLSKVLYHQLDVQDPQSIQALADFIQTRFGKLDMLVNNVGASGVVVDEDGLRALNIDPASWLSGKATNLVQDVMITTYDKAIECLNTNYYGVKNVTRALLPLLQCSTSGGRIVNSTGGQRCYRLTLCQKPCSIPTLEFLQRNCVHPGHVDTDLNWHTGTMTLQEGAQGSVMLALLPQGGPSGCYFDRTQVAEF
ncbi:hypothetical protein L1987_60018 [Smallanthus sonchifolius]|uniref:Uncharacterized protein n=1 Tax=Smallanthus sonchifolius TaxID=185202 RepID=A0ACB9D7H3_9ASTR|nr:hypothetical protein L1987_60018 [Smallanthus sonchifolius]